MPVQRLRDLLGGLEGAKLLAWLRGRLLAPGEPEAPRLSELRAWIQRNSKPASRPSADYACSIVERTGRLSSLTDPPMVHIGTIHSFKGAEADVVICYPDLSSRGSEEWQSVRGRDAILRMGYVAMTRARTSFVLVPPASTWHSCMASMPMEPLCPVLGMDETLSECRTMVKSGRTSP